MVYQNTGFLFPNVQDFILCKLYNVAICEIVQTKTDAIALQAFWAKC